MFEGVNINGMSISELANTLITIFPEYSLKVTHIKNKVNTNYLKSSVSRIIPDISKIKKLGWSPHISVKEGFKRTVKSFYEID